MFVVFYHLGLLFLRIHQNFEPLSLFFLNGLFLLQGLFFPRNPTLHRKRKKMKKKKTQKKPPEKHYKKF